MNAGRIQIKLMTGHATCVLNESRAGRQRNARARIHDLLKVPGLGPAKVAQIKAAFELGKRVCAGKLTAPAFESSLAVAKHFRPRFTGKREEMVIAVFFPKLFILSHEIFHLSTQRDVLLLKDCPTLLVIYH